jgi:hypothetical protein
MALCTKTIQFFGQPRVLACDGCCKKAWGINNRPKIDLDPNDEDDYAWLADSELGRAPADPGTYEGGDAKPASAKDMNKWCARECERSKMFKPGETVVVRDFSQRIFNMYGRHGTAPP